MIEFGKTLRAAREAKGYTVSQLAETTRLAPTTVEDLEKEDFTRIAAPIYGRGFVKLYCEAVGLDPKPFVTEFMDIFNGNHETSIKERPILDAQEAPTTSMEREAAPEPVTAPEPPVATPSFADKPIAAPEPDLFAPPPPPAEQEPAEDFFSAPKPPETQMRLSRYAAPVSQSQMRESAQVFISPAIWRVAALVCAAIVILWLGFLGVRALYRATSTHGGTEAPAPAQTAEEAQAATASTAAPRTQQEIPALYID